MKKRRKPGTKLIGLEDYPKKPKMCTLVEKEAMMMAEMMEKILTQIINFNQTILSDSLEIQESIKLVKKELKHLIQFLYFNLYGGQELITYAKMAYGNQFI